MLKVIQSGHYSSFSASPESLFERSVQFALITDANIGLLFSGGIDSTALAIESSKLPLLFARYDKDAIKSNGHIDEYPYAKTISEKLELDFLVDESLVFR